MFRAFSRASHALIYPPQVVCPVSKTTSFSMAHASLNVRKGIIWLVLTVFPVHPLASPALRMSASLVASDIISTPQASASKSGIT